MLELVFRVCGRKKECVGAGISGGGPPWAHEAGGAPSTLVARWMPPCYVLSAKYSQIFQKKIIFKFRGIWRTFIFGVFLCCTDNSDNKRKILIFILFNINNRK